MLSFFQPGCVPEQSAGDAGAPTSAPSIVKEGVISSGATKRCRAPYFVKEGNVGVSLPDPTQIFW